ncbi:MAG TPA: hypothetical protein VFZ26_13325 [Gemmatimonadales bacterium]
MRNARRLVLLAIPVLLPFTACDNASRPVERADAAAVRDTTPPGPPPWTPKPIVAPPAPDSAGASADSSDVPADSTVSRTRRRFRAMVLTPADSARWPVQGPAPLPGALLPEHRIVAYYGNIQSTRMGILGQIPRDQMLARLEETAMEWAQADPGRKVMPALHLITTVAQGKPGAGGKYRLRMGDSLINEVARWAEERGWIMFLDVQIGHSTVEAELQPLVPFLARPYVHLALDPEFAMTRGGVPGRRIGTLDATHVNYAIGLLAGLVDSLRLPPKVLVVHRFTRRMLTNHDRIRLDPRVQVVIQMDGFGSPVHKQDAYKFFIVPEPVQFTGFKLFYKNDKPIMKPEEVIGLWPSPVYVQYQ